MCLGSGLDCELGAGALGGVGDSQAGENRVTLSFANPHVAEKCRILAGMEPGKWYAFGELKLKAGAEQQQLVEAGLISRNRPSRYKRNFEYILTPAGEKLAALLRQIGVANGTH